MRLLLATWIAALLGAIAGRTLAELSSPNGVPGAAQPADR
jgi:hypothetical protein